jgi:hypothetical protein
VEAAEGLDLGDVVVVEPQRLQGLEEVQVLNPQDVCAARGKREKMGGALARN